MTMPALRDPYLDPDAAALLAAHPAPRKALFLDRDGVLNRNHGYVHTPARTDWVPGIFELVAQAHRHGYLPVVVTNQAGIGRGFYDEGVFLDYTTWVHEQFASRGTPLLATFWCPHHPEAGIGEYRVECACRKPRTGMLLAAIERFAIAPARSILIGDKPSDIEAAQAAGVAARLLGNADWGAAMAGLLGAPA